MDKHISTEAINTKLATLGIPGISSADYGTIIESEHVRFAEEIERAALDPANEANRIQYIANVQAGVSERTRRVVGGLAAEAMAADLIAISKREGVRFRQAVQNIDDGQDPDGEISLWLKDLLGLTRQQAKLASKTESSDDLAATGSAHIYSGKAALAFNRSKTRRKEPTVEIDFAHALAAQSYAWESKATFQMTNSELPLLFGVMFGFQQKLILLHSGSSGEKKLTVTSQQDRIYFQLQVKGDIFAVPALAKDIFPAIVICLEQIKATSPSLNESTLLQLVRRICQMQEGGIPK